MTNKIARIGRTSSKTRLPGNPKIKPEFITWVSRKKPASGSDSPCNRLALIQNLLSWSRVTTRIAATRNNHCHLPFTLSPSHPLSGLFCIPNTNLPKAALQGELSLLAAHRNHIAHRYLLYIFPERSLFQ